MTDTRRQNKDDSSRSSKPNQRATTSDGKRSQSSPHQGDAEQQLGSSAQTSVAAVSDVEEFIARARALGLTLTKEDYERARAGVSAFLRAKRVTQAAGTGVVEEKVGESSSGTKHANGEGAASTVADDGARKRVVSTSDANVGLLKSASHSKLPSAFSSLSFLTAVELVQEPKGKSRPRLDDISSLEERRRRRERRRRLRERVEREANDADCEVGSHRCRKAASESCLDSPVTCVGAEDTPNLSVVSKVSPYTEDGQTRQSKGKNKDAIALSAGALARLGLGIRGYEDRNVEQLASKASSESLLEAWQQSTLQSSPGLSRLSRKARIDQAGKLTLQASPSKDVEMMTEGDPLLQIEEEEAMGLNAGVDTDDSGVCFAIGDSQAHSSKKADHPPSHRRRLSSLDSSNLGTSQDSQEPLSLLDRIMAQKKSPLRLRKEAKERELERQASIAADNDLIVMTARTAIPMPPKATQTDSDLSASLLQPSTAHSSASNVASANDVSKTVRWASDPASSRMRMTTKEIYDYEFYGIAPNTMQNTSNAFPPWDAVDMDGRAAPEHSEHGQNAHVRTRSNFNHISFGSPVANRTGIASYEKATQFSPGMLSLSLQQEQNGHSAAPSLASLSMQLSAKRGLLFGGVQTPPVAAASSLDNAMLDMSNVFSHGPTLAQSPARKGLVDTETPPRLVRATTLAAPIALAYQTSLRDDVNGRSANGSPERSSLVRAQSYSSIERKGSANGRGQLGRDDDDKENRPPSSDAVHSSSGGNGSARRLPKGWAHRSPAGKVSATISPAALFGFPQSQHHHAQQHPFRHNQSSQMQQRGNVDQQKEQRTRKSSGGSVRSNQFSASEAEGDDERDMSPITMMQGNKAGNGLAAKRRKDTAAVSRKHQRNSSASTSSAYDDSPLMLDTRNSKATVVVRPTSGNSLAQALDMPLARDGNARSVNEAVNGKRKKKTDSGPAAQLPSTHDGLAQIGTAGSNTGMHQSLEWDKPDGSRIVKLVSEELQAAIESGTLTVEPAARFYKLPPGWGRSKDKPQSASYAGMIGQAILSSSDGRLSLNEIYNWIATVFPFFERGDRGWQNSIRHNLSLNKSFVKVERDSSIPGKGGWWAIKSGHEDRFRNGSYIAPGAAKAAKEGVQQQQSGAKGSKANANDQLPSDKLVGSHSEATARKRPKSDAVDTGDAGSDSDSLSATGGRSNSERKRKKGKAVEGSKKADILDGGMKPMPVTLLRPEGVAMSPKAFGMKTPVRADQVNRHAMGTDGSEFGSAYASSIMATLPLLTDASSPPSSPHNGMPPPAGGIRGAASSQSAQKQAQSALGLGNFFGHGAPAYGYSLPGGGNFAHHNMPASPLANVRGGALSSLNGRNSISLTAPSPESPLRQSNERSSMIVNSPPVSNVRESDAGSKDHDDEANSHARSGNAALGNKSMNMSTAKSPARYLQHSPVRGSPLRPGGALHQNGTMLSPASSQLQMVLGSGIGSQQQQQQQPPPPSSSQQSLSAGSMTTASSYGATTPLTARWGYASPSPSRRLDGLFSPGQLAFANTPNGQTGHGISTAGLDDPFDYSGNLQHEFDLTSDMQFHQQHGAGDPSPMKGFEHHAFGHRGAGGMLPLGTSAAMNALAGHFQNQQNTSPTSHNASQYHQSSF